VRFKVTKDPAYFFVICYTYRRKRKFIQKFSDGISVTLEKLLSIYGESDSSVSIVSDYGLDGRVQSPTEAEDFSSNLCIQTGSGVHPTSYTMGTGGFFPEGKKLPRRDSDHSPPSSAEVKKEWELYLLTNKCASMERNGTTFFTINIWICRKNIL
jgi:hypothetical protein